MRKNIISGEMLRALLRDDRSETLRELSLKAASVTRQYFGRTIALYAPLYLGNYCENNCVYCGFSSHHKIKRTRLTDNEITSEMKLLASHGIRSVLLLTGESEAMTPVSYIKNAVRIGRDYFPNISIEVQPLEIGGYEELVAAGVDGVTVYQETYDRDIYDRIHVSGKKKDFDYRYLTPERAAEAGVRSLSMGILLGLADPAEDVIKLFEHVRQMEKKHPGVEYSLSFPRIVPVAGMPHHPIDVSDDFFIKVISLARILFPRHGINLSTRECAGLRDRMLATGVTRMSAGSSTIVGGYTQIRAGEPQFDIHDHRSVAEIVGMLKTRGYDPVFTEWRRITDEAACVTKT